MSNTHKIAWCAGFFDGEGYVTIQNRKYKAKNGKVYKGYYLHMGINHVAPEPLIEFQKLLGGKITYYDKIEGNRKPRHQWKSSCNEAAEILKRLRPYLQNKNKVVDIGLEFQNTMDDYYVVPDEIQIYRGLLRDKIQTLNAMD